jgi:hypothetical protein
VKLRQILRRLLKPLVMASIAGGVAVSLVVTTPSNAQAFIAPFPPPILVGATGMALPEVIAATSLTGPIGWTILGVAAVGVGLYATKDYWLPYVSGAFGNDTAPSPGSGTGYGVPDSKFKLGPPTVNGSVITHTRSYTCPTAGTTCGVGHHEAYKVECKSATGVITYIQGIISPISGSVPGGTTANLGNFTLTCSNGTIPTGGLFGLAGSGQLPLLTGTQRTTGPGNDVAYGTIKGAAGFDPKSGDTKYKTTVECIRPDSSKFSVTKESTGADGALLVPSCDQASPGAHATGKMDVVGVAPPSAGGGSTSLVQAPVVTPSADKPLCDAARPGSPCKLAVKLDGQECVVGTWDCAHWPDLRNDPNQSTRLSCQYGPYVVPMTTCNPLERAYEEGGAPATEPNVDGNPSTRSDVDPNGNQIPRTSTEVGAVPGTGGTPSAVPGATAQESQCWPTGWGMLNPLEWVYRPVVCAAKELFEPKKDLQTRVTSMQGQFSNKVPVSWFSVGTAGVSGGSCPTDWALDIQGQRYSLICGTEADAIIRGFRPVMGAMLVIAALWPLIRSLFYAAIPVFKVTPS